MQVGPFKILSYMIEMKSMGNTEEVTDVFKCRLCLWSYQVKTNKFSGSLSWPRSWPERVSRSRLAWDMCRVLRRLAPLVHPLHQIDKDKLTVVHPPPPQVDCHGSKQADSRKVVQYQCCGNVTIFYGSGSGSDFWKVMVPVPVPTFEKVMVPVPVHTFEKLRFRFGSSSITIP